MGHRFEIYASPEVAEKIIGISLSFNVEAQIVGKVKAHNGKKLTINSPFGAFEYY
jgi:phosphoribosylformylglycinamidine cyclo-ligase